MSPQNLIKKLRFVVTYDGVKTRLFSSGMLTNYIVYKVVQFAYT